MSLKAFDLVPVVDRVNPAGEKSKSNIQCMEQIFENLYIGTSDCYLIHYCVERGTNNIGKTIFMNRLQRSKNLGLKKPIGQLLALPTIGHMLVLVDGCVSVVSMYGLEFLRGTPGRDLIRNVAVMARNNKPSNFSHDHCQICVGTRRKTIQVINLSAGECIILKEINLSDSPTSLAINANFICTNIDNQYYMIDYTQSHLQELFTYEVYNVKPVVKQLARDEFLLNGPTDTMGMIVTSKGLSMHQPLTWNDGFSSVAFSYPYILVLGDTTVTIHSILDQRQKQAMSFTGGVLICDFDGQVLIAMQRSIMAFVPVPFNKQIQMLLLDKRVEEAFGLLVVSSKLNPKQYDESYVKQVKAQAAFVYFSDAQFEKALPLFVESGVDPREVVVLYPLMMPASKDYAPSRPLLHNIKDLTVIVKGSKTVFADAKKMLLAYLESTRSVFPVCKVEIDTALMKLYAECNHSNLTGLVTGENAIHTEEAFTWLAQSKRFHALALYYHHHLQQSKKAFDIWRKLTSGELADERFPGLEFVVDQLTNVRELGMVWTNSSWVMKKDQKLGVRIFTARDDLDAEQVCDFLKKYPSALQGYLEFLVYERETKSEEHHTHLALIYVDLVIGLLSKSLKDDVDVEQARSKLQSLLESSSLYRVSSVLQKISRYPLYKEIATLYGKMEQHDRALKILVYQLKDFEAAEHYCDAISSGQEHYKKQKVFSTLLQIYLYPDASECNLGAEHFAMAAKRLLNKRQREFNVVSVLNMLPDDWTVSMIQGFISGSMRQRFSATRETRIESSLQKQLFLQTKEQHIKKHNGCINMNDENLCDFCKKPFAESTVARYPNGTVVHVRCAGNKSTCPVTGNKFK